MSSSPDTPMSQRQIDDLMQTLRRANAHHYQLAAASRPVSHPAIKARKHAQALRLSISVEAASMVDQRCVSTIPLPVLDLAPSPMNALEVVAPIPRYPSQIGTDTLAKKIPRPLLQCVIPTQTIVTVQEDVVSFVPDQCIPVSRWSASTTGTGDTEVGDDEEDTSELDVPLPVQIGVRYPRTDDNESLDILVSPDDDDGQRNDEAFAPIDTQFTLHLPLHNNQKPLRPPLPTRIPRHTAPLRQQQEQRTSPQPVDDGLDQVSSGSDSSQSSLEHVTPITSEEPPVTMARIKRKSLLDDVDMVGEDYDYYMVMEKRPRYERMTSRHRRGHQRRTSWPRKNV